ncbi:NAD(P)H-dependent oxidoreductase [Streptomyces sioyaensis]|uniref:NAD(P)H-dependent oxidoreductase n=1 Tax=Streptomyces sioyaensis TaxID=67364 RepID=UPI0037D5EDB6
MKWKAAVDADDFPDHTADRRLGVMATSERPRRRGRPVLDLAAEQEKVRWSDSVILHFPMWWFSVPAIPARGQGGSGGRGWCWHRRGGRERVRARPSGVQLSRCPMVRVAGAGVRGRRGPGWCGATWG